MRRSGRIEEFVSLQGNPRSRSSYQSAVRRYLDFIYGPVRTGRVATREEAGRYEELAEDYFTEPHNHAIDVQRFAASLNAAKTPPKSAHFWLSVVREFFKSNGADIGEDAWRMAKRRGPKGRRARTREATFNKDLIQRILPYMPLLLKVIFLTMISSGMRIGETLKLRIGDVHLDEEPVRITIPGDVTKNGDPRTTFISREAAAAIRAWLEVRNEWLQSSKNRNAGLLRHLGKEHLAKAIENDERLFPVHVTTVHKSFVTALEKAGVDDIDPQTQRRKLRLHQCRKFFRTVMAQRIPVDAVELMMGHDGYLTDAYVRYTEEELRQYYRQAEGAVCVGVADDVAAAVVGGHLDALQEENAALRGELNQIQRQITMMNAMQADVGANPEALQRLVDARIKEMMGKSGES